MELDRRTHRSSRPAEAIALFLQAAQGRLGVRALTLGTPDGNLIAGAGDDIERVAQLGARSAENVATWRTIHRGNEVVITSWGYAMSADLAEGVRRILSETP